MSNTREIDTGTPDLLCRVDERVCVVTMHRPEARNALTWDMKWALGDLLPEIDRDASIGCIVLTGAGGAFCSGGDTKRMKNEGRPPSPEQRKHLLRREHRIVSALYHLTKPTIACVPGPAAGAGLGLALACDLRLAAESAFFTTAYARLGLSGDYGASWFLTQLIGTARARELMFTSERVSATEGERLGLVNHVFPDDQLEKATLDLAHRIAAGPPIALRFMKNNLIRAAKHDLDSMLDLETERMVDGAQTNDYLEAMTAFQEKRTPVFKGE
jgi:enoyl-CoA hydratase/carnithine racemase